VNSFRSQPGQGVLSATDQYLYRAGIVQMVPKVRALRGLACQGRSKRKPLGRSKREPVEWTVRQGFSGEKGLWSVAEEALLPRSACGGGRFSPLRMGFVCGGFA
jgi:hypothetical protein